MRYVVADPKGVWVGDILLEEGCEFAARRRLEELEHTGQIKPVAVKLQVKDVKIPARVAP